MDTEARRRAEAIIVQQKEHCLTTDACCDLCALVNYIPDAVAQAVKERDEKTREQIRLLAESDMRKAEEIARLQALLDLHA